MMKIMKRDREGNVQEVGTVEKHKSHVTFNVPTVIEEMLSSITVGGKEYTPQSKDYMEMLPYYLSGDRLWAVPERPVVKKKDGPGRGWWGPPKGDHTARNVPGGEDEIAGDVEGRDTWENPETVEQIEDRISDDEPEALKGTVKRAVGGVPPEHLRNVSEITTEIPFGVGMYENEQGEYIDRRTGAVVSGVFMGDANTVHIAPYAQESIGVITHEVGHAVTENLAGAEMTKALSKMSLINKSVDARTWRADLSQFGLRAYSMTSASEFLADCYKVWAHGTDEHWENLNAVGDFDLTELFGDRPPTTKWEQLTLPGIETNRLVSQMYGVLRRAAAWLRTHGPGRGWWGPPKGTHGPGSQGGDPDIDTEHMSQEEYTDAVKRLKATDTMRLYHGTRYRDTAEEIVREGFDPTEEIPDEQRTYRGTKQQESGFFVSPHRTTSEGFGSYVIEFETQAGDLSPPPFGETHEFWQDVYPDSFNAAVSASLSMGESQALLTKQVPSAKVKGVWMWNEWRAEWGGIDGAWQMVTPAEFLEGAEGKRLRG